MEGGNKTVDKFKINMKTQIEKYLESKNIIANFNYNKKEISYKGIKQGREIKKTSGNEELVRAYLLEKLVKELGYSPENIEIEKEYDIGRPKVNKPRIDIMLKDKEGNAFLFIEIKKYEEFEKEKEEAIEKQLFNLAGCERALGNMVKYLVYYSCDFQQDKIYETCVIIDYEKYSSFTEWKEDRNSADTLPARYGKAQKEPFVKDGKRI